YRNPAVHPDYEGSDSGLPRFKLCFHTSDYYRPRREFAWGSFDSAVLQRGAVRYNRSCHPACRHRMDYHTPPADSRRAGHYRYRPWPRTSGSGYGYVRSEERRVGKEWGTGRWAREYRTRHSAT